jgi:hypothetical protein
LLESPELLESVSALELVAPGEQRACRRPRHPQKVQGGEVEMKISTTQAVPASAISKGV